jgi:DNA-binding NtrC family response regulator
MKKESPHILIVEDDVELCNGIMRALHREGYSPAGTIELRDAMFKLKNQKYACVLLDMKLGADFGGELVTFMRERADAGNTDTPILVISGHLDRALVEKIGHRIQGALVKPFDMKTLLEAVKKLVEKPKKAGES